MRTFRGLGIVLAVLAGLLARPAMAVDLAAEADFLFRRGTEAYQRGDYGSALERFHASNRLVPNRNVLFNIAYTYEKLQRYPEAYHYFLQVLEVERDPAQLEKIRQAMAALERLVGVLEVETTPPGATLYVDRKDLGSRGTSPRVLGLAPGALTLLVELAGHHSERILVPALAAGQRRTLQVRLRPVLGHVRLESPRGARLTVLNQNSTSCEAPCELALRPGVAELRVDLGGYRPFVTSVNVAADALQRLNPILRPETGRLVVKTDEPGAEVSSGGVTLGFTPAVVALPAGEHWVTLSRAGFRKERRRVFIAADSGTELRVSMKQEEEVTAASRVRERVERAPSSVSIVSRAELEAFRYPTIAEALRGVPGAYVWDDGSYVSVGFRGISRLGDYGNRVLVLLDGHPLNDNWLGSSYVGYEGRTDLGSLERIEIVRGPGSVVYGTSAMSGVINLVSRPVSREPETRLGLSAEGSGVGRALVHASAPIGDRGGIWAHAAVARGAGRDFFFPTLVDAEPTSAAGHARGMDGFDAGTFEGQLRYDVFSARWFWHTHAKTVPAAPYWTLVGDPRTQQRDNRMMLELRAEPRLAHGVSSLTRAHANHYRFRGGYARSADVGGLEVDVYEGSWVGLEQRLELTPLTGLRVLVGGEVESHFQVSQLARDESGLLLDETGSNGHPFWVGAGYA
ncbi:MAG TPA: PEGA domain-containing protein, partial [Polyangiaceae bacterium]